MWLYTDFRKNDSSLLMDFYIFLFSSIASKENLLFQVSRNGDPIMKMTLLILLIFVLGLSFAAQCSLGFSENINVQVLDGNLRPVQNAEVNFTFQVSKTTGKGYFTTPPFITNADGKTSYLVDNQEIVESKLDCNIVIKATYGSASTQKTIIAQNHENLVQLKLGIYGVTVLVVDQNEKPLSGAEVWIENVSQTTNNLGITFFMVKSGTSVIYVKYADGKVEDQVVVENDTVKKVGVGLYPFTLTVRDDNGNKLNSVATIGNSTFNVVNGTLALEKLATARPIVVVKYQNLEKEIDVDLTLKNDYEAFFDITAPIILNVSEPEVGEQILKINILADDPGVFPSGIAQGGVKLDYDVNRTKEWTSATVYQKKKGGFVAEIPIQVPKSRMDFKVNVNDKEGNSASVEGWFLVPDATKPIDQNNQTNGQVTPDSQPSGFPWLAVAGVLIIIIVLVLYFKYTKTGGGTEG